MMPLGGAQRRLLPMVEGLVMTVQTIQHGAVDQYDEIVIKFCRLCGVSWAKGTRAGLL